MAQNPSFSEMVLIVRSLKLSIAPPKPSDMSPSPKSTDFAKPPVSFKLRRSTCQGSSVDLGKGPMKKTR